VVRDAGNLEEHNEMFLKPVQRVRTRISTLPFRYSSVEIGILPTVELLRSNLLSLDSLSGIRSGVEDIVAELQTLVHVAENPILERLINSSSDNSVIVVKDSFWVSAVANMLLGETEIRSRVVHLRHLKDEEFVDRLVYLGSPFFFSSRFRDEPDTRFLLDPKSVSNHFIMFPFGKPPEVGGLINPSSISRSIRYSLPFGTKSDLEIEETRSEWELISSKVTTPRSETEIVEPARFVGLASGHHMWLSARPDSRCRVVVVSHHGGLELEARQTSELQEGEMIIERIGRSSPSLIDSVADGLGAARFRASQDLWKESLKKRIRDSGNLKSVQRKLSNDFGVDVLNLRHWAYDPRSIAPNSKSDFLGTCRFLGLDDSAEALWKDLQAIRKLHLRAGSEILARLRNAVLSLSADQVMKSDGMIAIEIQDCGALGVFRVEHIEQSPVSVPISMIDVVSKNDEVV